MKIAKKISWVLLYLAAIIPVSFSFVYFSGKNLIPAFIASLISMLIYTILVFKNFRFLSLISFFTMLFVSLLTLGASGKQANGLFPSSLNEKAFMLALPLLLFFILVNSIFWFKTKNGIKKSLALIFIFLSVFLLATFGLASPDYHQNFIYTRIDISILLIFSIFLIIKKRKLLGILGILLSAGVLLLSAGKFAEKTYPLEENEKKEVVAFVDPLAREMFDYYNKEDYGNFCKYCGFVLKNMIEKNPIKDKRIAWGPYIYFNDPSKIIRKGGRYYVEYPVKFQNLENLMYLTFVIENISSDSGIYGFAFSEKPASQANPSRE